MWRRPNVHLTPQRGWLNDPNGCVIVDGTWHCFFQFNPAATRWGPMHWGHATSPDGLRWTQQPTALAPDPTLGNCYSGCAVPTDDGLALLFTHHRDTHEQQSLAWLRGDRGELEGVVLPNPGRRHFRDPKVLRHGDRWIMTLTGGDRVLLYASDDLRRWTPLSEFTDSLDAIWECPELLQIDGQWVMVVSISTRGPQEGSGVVWWAGDFDGTHFHADGGPTFLDHGSDYYAPQSFTGTPLQIAWLNNWRYANEVPTTPWNGMLTVPRQLRWADGLRQEPLPALATLREPGLGDTLDIDLRPTDAGGVDIHFTEGERVRVTWNDTHVSVDRTRCGGRELQGFAAVHRAAHGGSPGSLRILVDAQSIEVFAADGSLTLTDLILPSGPPTGVDVRGAEASLWHLTARP